MPSPDSDQRAIHLWTIWMTALAVVVLWAAYLVRDVLLLIYMSGLLAVGFSPIVRLIERQSVLPIGTRRFPRWLAILDSSVVLFGTPASAREEIDRYVNRNAPDPWLTQKLARMHSDNETWCVVENVALNGEAQRALSRLDTALAGLTGRALD